MQNVFPMQFTKLRSFPAKGDKNAYSLLTAIDKSSGESETFYTRDAYNHLTPWNWYNFDIEITKGKDGKAFYNLHSVSTVPTSK